MLTDKQLKAAKIEPERLRARTELLVALAKTSDGAESLPDALPPVADGLDPVSVTRAAKAGLLEGAAECALLMLPEDNAQTLLVLPEENAQDGVALAQEAAHAFAAAGLDYGSALIATFSREPSPKVLLPDAEPTPTDESAATRRLAMARPEQQVYRRIAMALNESSAPSAEADDTARQSAPAHLTFGPLGLPLHTVDAALSSTSREAGAGLALLHDALSRRRQSLEVAGASPYLWKRGRYPVAYVDLSLIALTRALLARQVIYKSDIEGLPNHDGALGEELERVVQVPFRIALKLA